jgi:hypothetical protein
MFFMLRPCGDNADGPHLVGGARRVRQTWSICSCARPERIELPTF